MPGSALIGRYASKIAEMNDSHSYLFKKSKILKSVQGKYFFGSAKVDGKSKKQKIREFSSLKIKILLQKLSQKQYFGVTVLLQKVMTLKKVFLIIRIGILVL